MHNNISHRLCLTAAAAAAATACFLARIACEVVRGVIMAPLGRRRRICSATRRAPGYARALGEDRRGA